MFAGTRPDGRNSCLRRAVAATVIGCALAWGGLVVPVLKPLYDYAWFVGFFVSGAAHVALSRRAKGPTPVVAPSRA